MTSAALLLRVLLCLSLILNGSAYAMAGTQMQLQHAAMLPSTMPSEAAIISSDDGVAAPCDQSMDIGQHAGIPPVGDAPQVSTAQHDDCCPTSQCDCACVQHTLAALQVLPSPAGVDRSHMAIAISLGHSSPTLAHLIRPPIS